MNVEEAKGYFANTDLLAVKPDKLTEASKILQNNPEFLINFPEHLGMYYKNVDVSSWHNVLLFETKEPKHIFNKLRLICYMVYSKKNVDSYLSIVVEHSGPVLLVLTNKELDAIRTLFDIGSDKFYFGHHAEGKKNICYAVKKTS